MYGGRLECVGTQLRLKSKFGDGYKLALTLAMPALPPTTPATVIAAALDASADKAHAFVLSQLCPAARRVSRVGYTLTYVLPRRSTDVAAAFAALQVQNNRCFF